MNNYAHRLVINGTMKSCTKSGGIRVMVYQFSLSLMPRGRLSYPPWCHASCFIRSTPYVPRRQRGGEASTAVITCQLTIRCCKCWTDEEDTMIAVHVSWPVSIRSCKFTLMNDKHLQLFHIFLLCISLCLLIFIYILSLFFYSFNIYFDFHIVVKPGIVLTV